MSDEDETVGYGKPPKSTRFEKGVSGNPGGRKPGRHREAPYEAILGQMVSISENGVEIRMTAEEAFLRKMLNDAAKGKMSSATLVMKVLEQETHRQHREEEQRPPAHFELHPIPRGSVAHHLKDLRIVKKFDRFRETAYFRLEPFAVQDALNRFGYKRLTAEEQRVVLDATRTPHKVRWPDWWEVLP